MVDLLGCPFCSGVHVTDRYVRDGRQMFCQSCGASVAPTYHGPNNDTLARAKEAWNRRVPSPSISEAVEVIRPFAEYASLSGFDSLPPELPMTQGARIAAKQVTVADFIRARNWISNYSLPSPAGEPTE